MFARVKNCISIKFALLQIQTITTLNLTPRT